MKLYKTAFCLITGIILFSTASAQRYFGIATSEWSATNSLYLNPASIAGSHEQVTISLLSLNIAVDNNLGTFPKISNIGKVNNNDTNSNSTNNGIFTNSGRKNFSMLVPTLEMRGPGVLVGINNRMTIALTTRIRVINQLNHFDQSLYDQVTNPNTPTGDYEVSAQKFNWTANLWSEIGLSYGMIVMDDENGQIKAGVTIRHLSGIGYIGLKANNMDLKYSAGKDSFYASHTDLEFASNIVSTNSAALSGLNSSSLFGNLFGSAQGGGFGGDLGVTYTRILNFNGNDKMGKDDAGSHKISASASVMDIGAINYNKNNYTLDISKGNGYLDGHKIKDYTNNFDSIKAYAIQQGFNADTGNKAVKVHMPTALIISADYQVYRRLYVNATYIANLVNRQAFGNSVYNQITITPRYDSHVFTVGMPITYSALANNIKLGLGLRLGGFFLGSDDMLALMSSNQYGFGFYFGGYVPICRKEHKKDTPNDTQPVAPLHTTE